MLPAALAVGLCLPLLVLAQSGEKDGARRTLYVQRAPLCVEGLEASTRPQTLHQVAWLGEVSVLEHENKLRDSWMKHNQGWTHRVWDEGAVSALVKDSYPWFEETYHSLPSNQQRAEVAVYLVLHSFGGVFADTDVECFQKFDSLLEGPVLQIFEEPMDKWEKVDARGNTLSHHLVSGSLMTASQPGHPLLLKVLQKVRPAGEAYAPTNGQLIQKQLRLCQRTDDEGCGCYRTMRSEHFFPPHAALLPATNFSSSVHHVDELRRLVSEINTGKWPPQQASTVRWGLRKIDPGLDRLLVVGMQASLAGDEAGDEMLRAYVSAEWGKKEKYQTEPEKRAMDKARKAYEKAARLAPAYAWPHYELGNIELESKRYDEARAHFLKAVQMEPKAILFWNNLGVTELNLGLLVEAEASFRTVLELHPRTDDRLRRMAPAAGAHFNLGIALNASRRADEALVEIRAAMHSGSSHFARLAARRLSMAGALDVSDAEVGLIIATALFGEGRTREASVTLARAHELAESEELRGRIGQLMSQLADVWSVGAVPNQIRMPGALPAQGPAGKSKGVQYVRASADGSTSMEDLGELTPELLQQIKEGKVQLPPA